MRGTQHAALVCICVSLSSSSGHKGHCYISKAVNEWAVNASFYSDENLNTLNCDGLHSDIIVPIVQQNVAF